MTKQAAAMSRHTQSTRKTLSMKRIHSTILIALAAGAALFQSACSDNNNEQLWDQYAEWRNANISWIEAQAKRTNADGTPYYTKVANIWTYARLLDVDGTQIYLLKRMISYADTTAEATSRRKRMLFVCISMIQTCLMRQK